MSIFVFPLDAPCPSPLLYSQSLASIMGLDRSNACCKIKPGSPSGGNPQPETKQASDLMTAVKQSFSKEYAYEEDEP